MQPCAKFILNKTVTVRSATARTGPDRTLGTAVEIPAYVEPIESLAQSPGPGKELRTAHLIICETSIAYSDLVWLPGADANDLNAGLQPQSVDALPDLYGGVDHYEVIV